MDYSQIATQLNDIFSTKVVDEPFNTDEKLEKIGLASLHREMDEVARSSPNGMIPPTQQITFRNREKSIMYRVIKEAALAHMPQILPDAGFWFKGEEKPKGNLLWVISPYEVTAINQPTISVALLENEQVPLGYILDYENNHVYYGIKGEGALKHNDPFKIGDRKMSEVTESIHLQFVKSPGHNTDPMPDGYYDNFKMLASFAEHFNFRRSINSEYELINRTICYVAEGDWDFVAGLNACFPDLAASIAIIEQAGGVITDFSGSKEKLYSGHEFFAANKHIHQQFIDFVQEYKTSISSST